jgi:GT2 family glycosyltransferase
MRMLAAARAPAENRLALVGEKPAWPSVTIVFLVFNRREQLRESLRRMLVESDYDRDLVDAIVVDNASSDGSVAMVRDEFPQVRVIAHEANVGVSGFNAGFAAARGDWVLALDDDCYLPPDGLRRAVEAATRHRADLVSFKVVSSERPDHVFTDQFRTGLFAFWGCAVLIRRPVLDALGGYDPRIFVWANELELTVRLLDRGFRHLYLPDVAARHMKPPIPAGGPVDWRSYLFNARNFAYVAGKLFRARDALPVVVRLMTRNLLDGLALDRRALRAVPATVRGFAAGLRHRQPVRNARVSERYRRDFETFASPWTLASPPLELARRLPGGLVKRRREGGRGLLSGRREAYFAARADLYPDEPAVLEIRDRA